MMKTEKRTREDVKHAEVEALARTLGPVGAVRFLQQFGKGSPAADQSQWHGKSHLPTLPRKSKALNRKQP